MQILKTYFVQKGSIIADTARFRQELKDLNVPDSKLRHYVEEFMEAYRRSEDYDLASDRIFEELMSTISRQKSSTLFKGLWDSLTQQKSSHYKGELVKLGGKIYFVAGVTGDGGEYVYGLIDPSSEKSGKLTAIKVKATDDELIHVA